MTECTEEQARQVAAVIATSLAGGKRVYYAGRMLEDCDTPLEASNRKVAVEPNDRPVIFPEGCLFCRDYGADDRVIVQHNRY